MGQISHRPPVRSTRQVGNQVHDIESQTDSHSFMSRPLKNVCHGRTSFPNSVWERTSAKLCFASRKAELCGTGVPKPELGNKLTVWLFALPTRQWDAPLSLATDCQAQWESVCAPGLSVEAAGWLAASDGLEPSSV